MAVAAYVEQHPGSKPTVKQHLAAIKKLFDWLVTGGCLPLNPAINVRGPSHIVRRGTTPVLTPEEARHLLDHIAISTIAGLRDRALIGTIVYSFARISAALAMRVEDYYPEGKRFWLRLHEEGGKLHHVPAHHNTETYIDSYLHAAGIADHRKSPLFRAVDGKLAAAILTDRPLTRTKAYRMIRRRAKHAGIKANIGPHSFRATGITTYLENGGNLDNARRQANHADVRTTQLYDRRNDKINLDEVERIII